MKVLHIVRHAKAVSNDRGCSDFGRALTKKGVEAVCVVARRLRKGGFTADHMISSPATRARKTARIFAKEFEYPAKQIELCKTIYDGADNKSLLSLVQSIPATASAAFLFGHDPAFSDFARHLTGDLEKTMPKGGVVTVAFDTDSWADAGPGRCRLLLFDYPMSKGNEARRIKPLRREFATLFAATMYEKLKELDPRAADKIKPYMTKTMRKVAARFLELAPHLTRIVGKGGEEHRGDERVQPGTDS